MIPYSSFYEISPRTFYKCNCSEPDILLMQSVNSVASLGAQRILQILRHLECFIVCPISENLSIIGHLNSFKGFPESGVFSGELIEGEEGGQNDKMKCEFVFMGS